MRQEMAAVSTFLPLVHAGGRPGRDNTPWRHLARCRPPRRRRARVHRASVLPRDWAAGRSRVARHAWQGGPGGHTSGVGRTSELHTARNPSPGPVASSAARVIAWSAPSVVEVIHAGRGGGTVPARRR